MVDKTEAQLRREKARARKAIAVENRRKALQLRGLGMTFAEIGEQLDISAQAANKAYWKAIDESKTANKGLADEAHQTELYRLDRCSRKAMTAMEQGNLLAIDRVVKVEERRRKILGTEPPEKHAQTDAQGNDLPLPKRLRDMPTEEIYDRIAELKQELADDSSRVH